MNDITRRTLFERCRDTLFVFGFCGVTGVLVDLDHIWKIFGMAEPFSLTWFVGRALHTTLVFILYGVVAGSVANAYANRQGYFRRGVDIPGKRSRRGVSPVCWDDYSFNCDKCSFEWTCTKEVEMRWP